MQSNFDSFTLRNIAEWQINAGKQKERSERFVAMPALQRGYVWRPHQVEELWDSLIRRLPIGSFLLARYNKDMNQKYVSKKNEGVNASYLLMDGQQRATAIALAFADHWSEDQMESYPFALWVDLSIPGNNHRNRAFIFRLTTKSHPWGYERNEQRRLKSIEREKAYNAYKSVIEEYKKRGNDVESRYPGISVKYTWPWDAHLPVPFSLLCKAVHDGGNWIANLKKYLDTNYWHSDMPVPKGWCWKKKLLEVIDSELSVEYKRLALLAENIPLALDAKIPAIIIPNEDIADKAWEAFSAENADNTPRPDFLESLFVRVNSAGTNLAGEELLYSVFKAIWPNNEDLIEDIGKSTYLRPARLAAMTARLMLHRDKKFPRAVPPERFRTLVHAKDGIYRKELEGFVNDRAEVFFKKAADFLAGFSTGEKTYHLGSILTENLARQSPDVFFFFLCWLKDYESDINTISRKDHRRILGALTAIAWFAPEPIYFLERLWPLKNEKWWHRKCIFNDKTMVLRENKLVMIPLPLPSLLKNGLKKIKKPLLDGDKNAWKNWNWYKDLSSQIPKWLNEIGSARKCCKNLWENQKIQEAEEEFNLMIDLVWHTFWEKLWNERRLVLYAQRHDLQMWFDNYNPAAPDQLEDSDRPYDWDHILAQSYVAGKKGVLDIWRKDWLHTIGNLRAWPLELNRSDGDIAPAIKLETIVEETGRWNLSIGEEIRKASFIDEDDWRHWQKCRENSGARDISDQLKTLSTEMGQALLEAITNRICCLYENWYDELCIKDTFGMYVDGTAHRYLAQVTSDT